ncbi:MAG: S53 family peptidase [Bryobacteraceae bacterium]
MRVSLTVLLAVLLVASLSMAAPAPGALSGPYMRPPLHRLVTPPGFQPDGIAVGKMRAAYGLNLIKNYGKGQVIAIIDAFDDPNIEADLGVFSTKFNLPACTTANGCFQKIYQKGTKPPADTSGWTNEIAIDVEWAHAIAPAAKIILVEANSNYFTDMYPSVDIAVQNGATVVSMSWSALEYATQINDDAHFNVPGVTFVAASGDYGNSAGTQYPAASPYVVGVGGTSLTVNASTGAWASEVAWSGSGGGVSVYETEPSYQAGVQNTGKRVVPDVAWDADPNTGVPVYNSFRCGGGCPVGWGQWGGTSIGAPQWSAVFAIANSVRVARGKAPLTVPSFVLYPAPAADYHDITSGNNGSCGAQCNAGPGFDFVTGLGSPKANLIIPALVAAP